MSFVGDLIGDITGANQAAQAQQQAANTQAAATGEGIEEQRRQFDKLVELMTPYIEGGKRAATNLAPYEEAGKKAFGQQQALIGLQGADAQQQAIDALQNDPRFQALTQQGENAILQNASATGGLRGGNVQGALAQFRPQMLTELINQQYGRLGGIAGTGLGVTSDIFGRGQASAAGQAASGMTSASNIGNLLANQGQAIAGGQLAAGSANRNAFGDILGIAKTAALF